MRATIVFVVLGMSALAPAAAEEEEPRPFVKGGIYDKPFITKVGPRLTIGGYADAQFRYERAEGVLD